MDFKEKIKDAEAIQLEGYIQTRHALQDVFCKIKKIHNFGSCDADEQEFFKWLKRYGLEKYSFECLR